MLDTLKTHLKLHEGVVPHAYADSLGYLTIGVGRLIDKRKGGGLSTDEIDYLLDNDIRRIVLELERQISFWGELSVNQRIGLCSMAFQMGVTGLLSFRLMLAALQRGDLIAVKAHAEDSRWWRQTPTRAAAVIELLMS